MLWFGARRLWEAMGCSRNKLKHVLIRWCEGWKMYTAYYGGEEWDSG